ncbi:hypothetical protein F511_40614 [Dorcoceras hygrometricum]|uniref:Uncharacterized protein n=1 Tax=Dorcoceras hygrometricum TaxID=472368 RepID=A0A2Z7A0K0_9LAMI|nr:hypothetical protein F511_40614 [Dorcoceras hygrometricum]
MERENYRPEITNMLNTETTSHSLNTPTQDSKVASVERSREDELSHRPCSKRRLNAIVKVNQLRSEHSPYLTSATLNLTPPHSPTRYCQTTWYRSPAHIRADTSSGTHQHTVTQIWNAQLLALAGQTSFIQRLYREEEPDRKRVGSGDVRAGPAEDNQIAEDIQALTSLEQEQFQINIEVQNSVAKS